MSLRQVLTIYNAERQLNEDDTALLNTLRRFTEPERALLIEQLSDKPQKKSSKKSSTKPGSKSARASGMQAQLSNRRQEQKTTTDGDDSDQLVICQHGFDGGGTCKRPADHNIHHLRADSLYHEFQPPQQAEAASGD